MLCCLYAAGSVYYVDEACRLKMQFVAEASVKKLLYYDDKNILVTVSTSMMLTLHGVTEEGETTETMKVTAFCFVFVNQICRSLSHCHRRRMALCNRELHARNDDDDRENHHHPCRYY